MGTRRDKARPTGPAEFSLHLKRQLERPPMLAMPLGTSEIAVEPAIQRDTIWKRVAHMNCWRPCFGALLYKRGTRRTEGNCGYPTSLDRIYHKSPCNEFHGCRIPSHLLDGFGKFIGKDGLMALPSGLASG